jgi:HK97 gp10 family phage protein
MLRNSLILKKRKVKNARVKSEYYVTKKSGVAHFAPVELGTSKMKAQPFLRPAIDENKHIIAKRINDQMLKAIGRVT